MHDCSIKHTKDGQRANGRAFVELRKIFDAFLHEYHCVSNQEKTSVFRKVFQDSTYYRESIKRVLGYWYVFDRPLYIEHSFEFKYSGLKNDLCRKKFTIFYREYFAWQQIAQSYHFCRYECRYVSPIFAHSFPSHQNDGPQSKFPFSKSVFSKYALCFTFPPNSTKRWL